MNPRLQAVQNSKSSLDCFIHCGGRSLTNQTRRANQKSSLSGWEGLPISGEKRGRTLREFSESDPSKKRRNDCDQWPLDSGHFADSSRLLAKCPGNLFSCTQQPTTPVSFWREKEKPTTTEEHTVVDSHHHPAVSQRLSGTVHSNPHQSPYLCSVTLITPGMYNRRAACQGRELI